MNKSEFYKSVVEIHTKSGQGVPKFIAQKGNLMDELEELIEEKMVTVTCIPSISGMFPDDYWIVPTGCYNLWTESNHMLCLMYVRKFLNILEDNDLHISDDDKEYLSWLETNKEQLSNILTLESNYISAYYNIHNTFPSVPSKLTLEESEYLTKFKYTKEREKGTKEIRIKHLNDLLIERISITSQIISQYEKIIRLVTDKEKDTYLDSLSTCEKEISIEKAILKKIKNMDQEKLVEEINK